MEMQRVFDRCIGVRPVRYRSGGQGSRADGTHAGVQGGRRADVRARASPQLQRQGGVRALLLDDAWSSATSAAPSATAAVAVSAIPVKIEEASALALDLMDDRAAQRQVENMMSAIDSGER